jgi:hypothetical protein
MLDSGRNGRQDGVYSRATEADHEVPEQSHLHTTSGIMLKRSWIAGTCKAELVSRKGPGQRGRVGPCQASTFW